MRKRILRKLQAANSSTDNGTSPPVDKFVCITQDQNGKWTSDGCKKVEIATENGDKAYSCECSLISPASIVNDFSSVFTNTRIDDVFDSKKVKRNNY